VEVGRRQGAARYRCECAVSSEQRAASRTSRVIALAAVYNDPAEGIRGYPACWEAYPRDGRKAAIQGRGQLQGAGEDSLGGYGYGFLIACSSRD